MGSSSRLSLTRGEAAALYAELVAQYGEVCALCRATPKTRRLHIDHDHRTGAVRGLLCMRCNRALPAWVTPEWLCDAYHYLSAAREREDTQAREGMVRSAC